MSIYLCRYSLYLPDSIYPSDSLPIKVGASLCGASPPALTPEGRELLMLRFLPGLSAVAAGATQGVFPSTYKISLLDSMKLLPWGRHLVFFVTPSISVTYIIPGTQ